MSILGNAVRRVEDPRLLTVGGRYVDDISCDGALHAVFVRSTVAHGRLTGVDTAAAAEAPGVVAVYAAADVDLEPWQPAEFASLLNTTMRRPWLARDIVRFVGEPVAMVVASSRAEAADAAELVAIDYEPLPALVEVTAADESSDLLFAEAGTNVASTVGTPPADDFFDGCEVVVTERVVIPKVAAVPLEPRAAVSSWGDDGRLTHWTGTQRPHAVRAMMATILDVAPEDVRLLAEDVGGGFGARMYPAAEEVMVAWAARRLGRPVRWVETRTENLLALGHGRAQVQQVELGGTADGRMIAYRLTMLQDAGAYPEVAALLPNYTALMAPGVYTLERVDVAARSVVTNTAPVTAYRGAGRPEATTAIERAVEVFAARIGVDAIDVRRRNAIPASAFPYTTPTGVTYDSGNYHAILDLALHHAGYDDLRKEQRRRREQGDVHHLGIGVSLYTEITNATLFPQYADVTFANDGRVTICTGENPTGQGHATAWTMIASERLGIPMEHVTVVHGDTAAVQDGTGTGGSSALQTAGMSLLLAIDDVVAQGRDQAARLFEAAVEDVEFDAVTGRFHVAGTPSVSHGWHDVAAAAETPLFAAHTFTPTTPTFPFGAYIVIVDVDTETGAVDIERVIACDDAGRILNPLLAEGQLHGGIAQGLAQALLEEVRYDADGNLLTSTLADYAAISAAELPSFELDFTETPADNPLGAKGIGESGTIASSPALLSAVLDALAPFGVASIDMPVTPERVWRALTAARR